MQVLKELFCDLDPRRQNSSHDFCEMLFIAIAATLCGAKGCTDFARFGEEKRRMLGEVLVLAHGIPSHDAFSGLFRKLDAKAFAAALARLLERMASALGRNRQIAIDGKAMRGAFETGCRSSPRMLVTAWGREVRMSLAALPADGGNEAKAAIELLGLLDLDGAIVTGDALHCSKPFAGDVVAGGGDYCLALKGNQAALHADAEALVQRKAAAAPVAVSQGQAHGRQETRAARVVKVPPAMRKKHRFPGLSAIGEVRRARFVDGRLEEHRCLYALSRPMAPEDFADVVRQHWDIENGLHWGLDVIYREDECRSRKDSGAENLALIRRISVNAFRADSKKDTMRGKMMRAGWNDSYLFHLMTQMR